MDIKIAACMSRIKNASLAKKNTVGQLAKDVISSALKGLELHLDPESADVENGLKIQVVSKI